MNKILEPLRGVLLVDFFRPIVRPTEKDILADSSFGKEFEGGTIYQAFLSALSYHRRHAPVTGTVGKAYVIDGTYYSEPLCEGLGDPNNAQTIDMGGETTSQGYLTEVATRAVMLIEADDLRIGLMGIVGVGMAEVSTCEITVKEGDKLRKGDEIGIFHFGGSTHCLLFKLGVSVSDFPSLGADHNIPVRSKLAVVT